MVLSRDENDPHGPAVGKVVEEVFVRLAPVWELLLGGRVIGTTQEHPFYAWEKGWVPARGLAAGDTLLCEDGVWRCVDGIRDTGEWQTVYNVRVADFHTYFVGCDEWGFSVWAHNACIIIRQYPLQDARDPALAKHWSVEIEDNTGTLNSHLVAKDPPTGPLAVWERWTTGKAEVKLIPGPGAVRGYGKPDLVKRVTITEEQAAEARKFIVARLDKTTNYSFYNNSCFTYVALVAQAAGQSSVKPAPAGNKDGAEALIESIKNLPEG